MWTTQERALTTSPQAQRQNKRLACMTIKK
jgi:hypothetical protein